MNIDEYNFESNQVNILYHKYLYYELSNPVMTDYAFDMLCKQGDILYQLVDKTKYPNEILVHEKVGFSLKSAKKSIYWKRVQIRLNRGVV